MSLPETKKITAEQTPDGQWFEEHISDLLKTISPDYFTSKRWFGSKTRQLQNYQATDFVLVATDPTLLALIILQIEYAEGEPELYHLPLAFGSQLPDRVREQAKGIATTVATPQGDYYLYDAFAEDAFCKLLYQNIYDQQEVAARQGNFAFASVQDRLETRDVNSIKRINTEQSNTSVIYNNKFIMKAFRKLTAGKNPDFEVPFFLTTHTSFGFVPKMAGYIEYHQGEQVFSIAAMQDFVQNNGDGYTYSLDELKNYYREAAQLEKADAGKAQEFSADYLKLARRLGEITGELHNALASNKEEPDFAPELITETDVKAWQDSIRELINKVCNNIKAQMGKQTPQQRQGLQTILDHQQDYLKLVDDLAVLAQAQTYKTRYHGDYHLGQVLKTGDDFVILDFEGEPARSLAERRAKHSPLKDEAGMLRSFNYAAYAGLFDAQLNSNNPHLEDWAGAWEKLAVQSFEDGYNGAISHNQGAPFVPASDEIRDKVLNVFLLEKAFYELNYEFNNRPTWIPIPLKGILRIIGQNL